ncbi:MAG: DUF2752 domain-containing protein [Candidatus Dormibacteria bacterium]
MVALHTSRAARARGPEPAVAAAGSACLATAWVLPGLWSRGLNPIPPCLFHTVTGQPCPFCGGTRSFVAMAHGQLGAAAHVFPIGPALFLGLVAAVLYSSWAVATGRRVRLHMDQPTRQLVTLVAVAVLLVNWASKLFILGY